MAENKLFYVAAKGLITNENGEILLLYVSHPRGAVKTEYWDLPGGRIQEGSDAVTTLLQEVGDETALLALAAPEFFTAVISKHDAIIDGRERGLAILVYKITSSSSDNIIISDEHTDFEWVSPTEAASRLSNKYPPEFTDLLIIPRE